MDSLVSFMRSVDFRKLQKWADPIRYNWHLGFTSFGGPAVHFQIFRRRFVDELQWINEQTALPGPGSTKMLFCINLIHAGLVAAVLSFILWSLPAALAAFGLAQGISRIKDRLPDAVYALLSGLSAATVGTIALAAVQLSRHTVTDQLSRILVFLGATSGLAAVFWDYRIAQRLWKAARFRRAEHLSSRAQDSIPARDTQEDGHNLAPLRYNWKTGLAVVAAFFASFLIIMVLRSKVSAAVANRGFALFGNMYLAGTIIFGGGPVVIPLLREYVVAEGWVSPRDFLLGLAITQAFPGPNFNFAVFLGTLAMQGTSVPLFVGALTAFLGIFAPGLILVVGTMAFWKTLRRHLWFRSALRGTNSAAVGLVYTAVYRLWLIGYIDAEHQYGSSLDREPWWVVVVATAFFTGMWFSLQPVWSILLGGVMGLVWYGVVSS